MRRAFVVLAVGVLLRGGLSVGQGVTQSVSGGKVDRAATRERSRDAKTVDHYRRTKEWVQVEQYMKDRQYYLYTLSHWIHKPENESKTMAAGARELGLQEPDSEQAYENAMDVMTSDPRDDLGFMAITFCMNFSEKEGPIRSCSEAALNFLDRYYISDPRIKDLLLTLARSAGDRGEALLDKVIEKSKSHALRGEAAYWMVEEKHNEVDDAKRSAAERATRRGKMLRLAHLVEKQYGDVLVWGGKPARDQIKPILFSLEHLSLGDVMPDMKVRRVDGREDDLTNYRGKVVLLDYWATWCIPCVHSLREYVVPLKKELAGKPFEVITLSIDDKPTKVDDFTKNVIPLPFVNWYIGMSSPYYSPWGLAGVPHYYLLDKNGVIRANTLDAETLLDTARNLANN